MQPKVDLGDVDLLYGGAQRASKSRKAGTGIEPVNSGFADRGLTTWLPRRIGLPEPTRWLSTVFNLSLVASCCQLSGIKRISANVRPAIAHRPVQRRQAVQVLFGWLQSQWQEKAALFQGRRRRQSETCGACQAAKKRGAKRARHSSGPQSFSSESGQA